MKKQQMFNESHEGVLKILYEKILNQVNTNLVCSYVYEQNVPKIKSKGLYTMKYNIIL